MLYIPYVAESDIDYASTYQDYQALLWFHEKDHPKLIGVRLDWQRYKGWHNSEYDPFYASPATAAYVESNENECAKIYERIYGEDKP